MNWNIERNRPGSRKAESLVQEIMGLSPDLVCLTEAWETSLEAHTGHVLTAKGVAWSEQQEAERKIVLWSPKPWTRIDTMETVSAFGGAISGWTELANIPVRVVGLCIPYHMANPLGQVPRSAPWGQHERFLEALAPMLVQWRAAGPVIVAGDFNRRMPRTYGPKRSYQLLEQAFTGYEIATRGRIPEIGEQTVDHVAFGGDFRVTKVEGRSARTPEGLKRSDHFGVVVECDGLGSNRPQPQDQRPG